MAEQDGDLTLAREETIALNEGRARIYRGRVIPIISGGETPPADPPQDPPADPGEARPDWLPEQFKDEQALLKSYNELQSKLGSQGSELGELRGQMDEMLELMQQQPAQQTYQDPNQNPLVQEYERAYQEGDVQRMLAVQAQISQAAAQQVFEQHQGKNGDRTPLDDYSVQQMGDQIAQKYGADDEVRASAMKQIEENPLLQQAYVGVIENPNATLGDLARVVDTAYQLAGATAMAQEKASLAQQQAEQERGRQRKIDAETLTPSGQTRVAPKSEQEDLWKAIKGSDDGRLIIGER